MNGSLILAMELIFFTCKSTTISQATLYAEAYIHVAKYQLLETLSYKLLVATWNIKGGTTFQENEKYQCSYSLQLSNCVICRSNEMRPFIFLS